MSTLDGAQSRTLRVHSPAIPRFLGEPALHITRLAGTEGINKLFEYRVFLKTPDGLNLVASQAADFNLDDFIGREITVTIELDGAGEFLPGQVGVPIDHIGEGLREISGLITDAQLWGEEGRHIQYVLTVRPWLHLATLSTDCKIFQNKTVVDILDELLADYPFPVEKLLYDSYPVRDYQTQLNESDFAFFERLCQEWGISYHFEHSEGKHRLVLSDAMGAYKPNNSAAYRQVEYHAAGWKVDAEYIHAFAPHHQLTSGRYTTRDYDYTRPKANLASALKDPRPTGQADGEVYHWHASQGGSHYAQPRAGSTGVNDPAGEGGRLALLRMQALRSHGARANASGNLRGMVPGCTFKLQKHPRSSANAEYLILDTQLVVEDVGHDSQNLDARKDRRQQWRVEVDLVAHPVIQPLRPELTRSKPHTGGPQPALVVGPEGQNIWTDDLGRIKVQFPWDRIGQKNQHSSCWVRVSSPWAGNQLGGVHIPRIGQEVIVEFYGGDPDLPICTGRVHNAFNQPPWRLPDQSALSGFRSRELTAGGGNSAAGRSNHVLLDDTAGKIQAQLKSDHQHSQLSLGHITRIEDHQGRKDARGEGFELRTDGHGVVRAKDGLLITTEARGNAARHAKDMGETVERLFTAHDRHQKLSASAQQAQAHGLGDQDAVARAVKAQNDAIQGGAAGPDGAFPELGEPHLVLASPAGIEATTAGSTHMAATQHIALTSGQHTSIGAGQSLLVSAARSIRLFAYEEGTRVFAFKGDIDVKALEQNLNLLAKVKVTMVGRRILISAEEELVLAGGGSSITLDASGIREATAGAHIEYATSHSMVGPKNGPTQGVTGSSELDKVKDKNSKTLSFVLCAHQGGRPYALEPYTLLRDGTEVARGVTDAYGQVTIANHQRGTGGYQVRLANGSEFDLPVATGRLATDDDWLRAEGHRAAQDDPQDRLHGHWHQQDQQADNAGGTPS